MKIKHHEIDIPKENPFANCKLEREPYAKVLTSIVNTYADGFVLAINNEWGTGKTTFVKMWQQQLHIESFQTIYFNAWENDFDSNPLVAIISELKTLTKTDNKAIFKSVVAKGAVLANNVVPALVKAVLKKYVGDVDGILTDLVENTTKGATEILENEIAEYAHKKKTIKEFRTELEKFIKKSDSEKPLIFIIDELDRCRPTYAVEILEQLKHFFSVSGIVFVLSIDKNHLASSVKGYYGSSEINTDEYLRRFIDLEYSIPKPKTEHFAKYLFEYYSFKDFFLAPERAHTALKNDVGNFLRMSEFLLKRANATLRQQEKIFGLARLVISSFIPTHYVFPDLLFFLVFLKIMDNNLFQKINNGELSDQQLAHAYEDLMPSVNNDESDINLLFVEALLIWFYNNEKQYTNKTKLFVREANDRLVSPILSKYNTGHSNLAENFVHIDRQRYDGVKISYLLNKINLIDTITTS